MSGVTHSDFLVIGAGIAGASIAHWLAPHAHVVILEREAHPGLHATGRSAALFLESYGPPQVRALTRASRAFLDAPPAGFSAHPLLTPRGALFVATEAQREQLADHEAVLQSIATPYRTLAPDACLDLVPVLSRERVLGGVYEPDAADIDVEGLLQGYLRTLRRSGGSLQFGADVRAIERAGAGWIVEAGDDAYRAPVIVNCAGAWVDEIARMAGATPIGIQPKRRSAFTFAGPAGVDVSTWPMVIGADESWYFKPDAGMLLGSPANADPAPPHDVRPEELDIALAIDRIEAMTTLTIRRPAHTWAGLRSFAPDGALVGGLDPACPGFFWVAGQGGFGIQTSAAMGEACAALALGLALPQHIQDMGVSAEMLSPARFHA